MAALTRQNASFGRGAECELALVHVSLIEAALESRLLSLDARQLVMAACLVAAARDAERLALEEGVPEADPEDPAVIAERARLKEEQRRQREALGQRNEERKRGAEAALAAAGDHVPLARWDEARVRAWLAGEVGGLTAAEVQGWGAHLAAAPAAAALVAELASEGWRDRFLARLGARPPRTPGQCLAMANGAKLAGWCGGEAAVGARLAEALKVARDRDLLIKGVAPAKRSRS